MLHIQSEITLGKYQDQLLNLESNLESGLYCELTDKNPFDFKLSDVLEDDTEPKIALTLEQEANLLSFMESDKVYKKYRDEIIILLETGLRVSELCGLTVKDLDFQNRSINVDHQLLRDTEVGYYTEPPKTNSGIRQLPMSEKAYQAFSRINKNRKKTVPIVIDGFSSFLFLNREGLPKVAGNYEGMVKGLIRSTTRHMRTSYLMSPHILSDIHSVLTWQTEE